MIGKIKGKIESIRAQRAIIDVGGVGYIVNSIPSSLSKLKVGSEAKFWTHTAVRENDISIYGFELEEELFMFEKLLSVSGIGPKSALTTLSVAGLQNLEDAIISGNTAILTKIGGVGKKTADKIVLELSGKVVSTEMSEGMKEDLDVMEALRSLGYKESQVKEIMKEIPEGLTGANDKIREALKMLGKK